MCLIPVLENHIPDPERQRERWPAQHLPEHTDAKAIFISYAWSGESENIANQVDHAFNEKGVTIIRDQREIGFKDRIKDFMERIGRGKRRDAALAQRLFWAVLDHLQKLSPGFAAGCRGKGLARRFRRVIHVVDSSTIALIASCIDWAQHRRRKAAAKLHVRLDLHSLLPRFVLVESAKAADSIRAAEVCAGVKSGEIVIFDRAYVDFVHLGVLDEEGIFWVTRSKESLSFRVVKKLPKPADKRILSDQLVCSKTKTRAPIIPNRCAGCELWWRSTARSARWNF
jgi:hypothetical protein